MSTRPSWRQTATPSIGSGRATPRARSAAIGRPGSSTAPTIRLPASKLRPVSDPIVLLLTQLRKVMFIVTRPPDVRANPARHVVVRFQQALFRASTSSAAMKEHLRRLQHAVPTTIVDIDFGMAGRLAREIALRDSTEAARALTQLQQQQGEGEGEGKGEVAVDGDGDRGHNTGVQSHGGRSESLSTLIRVPSMEDGNPLTNDVFVTRNTLTYQQLHRIVELELHRCGYYSMSDHSSRRATTTTATAATAAAEVEDGK